MAKKRSSLPKWGKIAVVGLIVVVGVYLYSAVKPYLGWKTYTIDNFISFKYPSGWHFQVENSTTLSGEEGLFLVSDFEGELSPQDASSADQKFLIQGNRISKSKMKSLEEYAKPFLSVCDDASCSLKASKIEKDGIKIEKIRVDGNEKTFFRGEYFYYIEGKDYYYEMRVGYFGDAWLVSNPLRKLVVEKIVGSIDLK